jgi:ATP-dependent Lon protease
MINQLLGDEEMEFMPMIPLLEDDGTAEDDFAEILPILPLRNTTLYPGVVIPITVNREKSIQALNEANRTNKLLGVLAQKEDLQEPNFENLFQIGTVAKIVKLFKMPDGSTTVIIQGRNRFKVEEILSQEPFFKAKVSLIKEIKTENNKEFDALLSNLKDMAVQMAKLSPNMPNESSMILKNIENPVFLMHFISSNLSAAVADKQLILETNDWHERAKLVTKLTDKELQLLELKNKITQKTRVDIDKQQKEYFLNQQLKSIHEELGVDDNKKELKNLKERGALKKWDEKVAKVFDKELEKLARMHTASSEYSVVYNYVETLLELPWENYSVDNFDLNNAKKVLDEDHYGLDKVKDRILEYLAVLKLKGNLKSPILCLLGPPGVGKTSLGKSIARSLDRKFIRMSLGGLHDEAEIRGHRKTYIGAMPGRILQNLKKVGTGNPVFMLDEIDKLGNDHRGDPSSAMLEVLDPEQNHTFYDNFLELEYDLSKIMFVATANNINSIQPALRDRMEIIDISGYAIEEKMEIAKKYLISKQREAHGLKASQVKISPAAVQAIIEGYTRESGVRDLDRQLASIMRNTAKNIAMELPFDSSISAEKAQDILGKVKYDKEQFKEINPVGVVIGLAWTPVGGDLLYIESSKHEGKGTLTLTGKLGDVMKESATTALSYIRSNADKLGIDNAIFDKSAIHIHVPEGAVPKDGPSAGITMFTAITSLLTGRKVKQGIAMTGEITLRGKVLPVGGIKEKILAAKRAGIKEIILCKQNQKDIEDINQEFIKDVTFHYVTKMIEVFELALKD